MDAKGSTPLIPHPITVELCVSRCCSETKQSGFISTVWNLECCFSNESSFIFIFSHRATSLHFSVGEICNRTESPPWSSDSSATSRFRAPAGRGLPTACATLQALPYQEQPPTSTAPTNPWSVCSQYSMIQAGENTSLFSLSCLTAELGFTKREREFAGTEQSLSQLCQLSHWFVVTPVFCPLFFY